MLRVTCLCSCYAALSSQLTKQHKDNSQLPPACSKMIFVQPFPFLISYVPLLLSFFSFCSFEEYVRRNDRAGILWTTIKIIWGQCINETKGSGFLFSFVSHRPQQQRDNTMCTTVKIIKKFRSTQREITVSPYRMLYIWLRGLVCHI